MLEIAKKCNVNQCVFVSTLEIYSRFTLCSHGSLRKGSRMSGSSKELGFFNPRSQLDSTVVTYCPMQLKNGGGTSKGEWEREWATLV